MDDIVGASVLVTGASGSVGRHVVLKLASQGWTVRAAARNTRSVPRAPGVEPVTLHDLGADSDCARLMDGVGHVVHLAAIAHHPPNTRSDVLYRVNAEAAGVLAESAARARVERFVFVSSVRAQCGPSYPGLLREETPACPTEAYGRSKLAGERKVLEYMADAVILRPVVVYGPGVKGNMAALRRAAELPFPLPFKGLKARRSILSVGNLVDAIAFCLKARGIGGETFLVADPEPRSIREIVSLMRNGLGRSPGLFGIPTWSIETVLRLTGRKDHAHRLLHSLEVDIGKFTRAGWRPVEGTEEALRDMMLRRDGA